ncbi:MAG: bifunctional 23S rRNA (guanine(2069)-N(7))-methyltransferase RlmK/23S rRNA (guanine(2445)-N(2))-methyltransferase RlmL [Gammaproteobacteria bacterium]|nr:MAG: bifunctional 23S rRNA (guanine(2069)-N(7))-methyltransferase RlmK/23S rRNA (guanine(2445)-N(2))-methyltransferase RlmL [Gammaproteobacteria bacterium]TLZ04548.1 MAG: bifunctional 23S rRNA (guanine(2069)-N(7))-methyltransferase RlmK/23S rRNA (guanine(2445)-N(2))-methyltransferase RlmL [Gammaproteobacteria bacterium]TLZ43033.1 MAG: bifunctional 23S rRNA (guanine(2069)-N(7))-methyltransferase RlmK/23S rRNA (guanine(2445)-N(2))-methyltransferase RlmL [Gammaproteobacteria bacterium]
MQSLKFLASAPRGFADLVARELGACGAAQLRERSTSVAFAGTLESAYRACLWSRAANRVFLELAQFEARDADEFHAAVRRIDWAAHLGPATTLACDFSGRHPAITHSHFGALKLKDGIVDALRFATGTRPDVALERPGVRVHAHARGTDITVSIDLSGDSLHRRGYRGTAGEAPLKENVAAGVLLRCGWPELAAQGAEFLDPMCGSGTLCIEAALIAADRAPGLGRDYFGFLAWRGHDAALWARLREEAEARAAAGEAVAQVTVRGTDRDPTAIRSARDNAARAGVGRLVRADTGVLADAAPLAARAADRPGLLCTNPPYGLRMQDREGARTVHRELGAVLRERFQGWNAAVLTGAPELGMELGLRAHRTHSVWNGGIECRLLRIKVVPESARAPGTLGKGAARLADTPGARMFANRLGKNLKRLHSWAERESVSCYRVYDADMPEYAFAIDLYRAIEPDELWLYVQEYAAPAQIEPQAVRRRRGEVLAMLPGTTGVAPERIRVRTRRRTRRGEQYDKVGAQARFHVVTEGGLRFRVNFEDYLDTGLFLDQRTTRARLRDAARGKRFLNLFAYTGAATVYAAAGGAASTTSVDLSRTYIEWGRRNLALNALTGEAHAWVQADCREWLTDAARGSQRFDLVFLDPPTFSNSKRMQGVLDIERDHPELIDACARLLAPQGLLLFSTNAQRFRLQEQLAERYQIRDLSAATLPRDFERNPRIHRCFEVRPRAPQPCAEP